MTPTQCTRQQLLDWEREAYQILNQNPMPFVAKVKKIDLSTQKWLANNSVLIQASKDRIEQVGKKFFECDLNGILKEEVKDHQVVNILLEGKKIEDFQKEMRECMQTVTSCMFE